MAAIAVPSLGACAGLAGTAPGPAAPTPAAASTAAAAGLVDVTTLVPDMALEIRYAGNDNFTGGPVDGYRAPKCLLLGPAAQALQRVEMSLRERQLRLKLFDCYRPARAVAEFVRWAGDLSDQRSKPRYYPNLDKRELLGDYIAPVSGHSRGATLDLTLMQCGAGGGDCRPLDMGTDFDFFDPRAHTESPDTTPAQRANRLRLREAMAAQGFRNYPLEWWHYTLAPEPAPPMLYDVPIQ
ncbi:M15 family metallopeptidase [Cognatiluteimonas sedimenti]|uniref:M15 family metallopeptidase n=1 Tax=Cognatiluteimonas sedimenti TaxID=2927791 RepID=UPI003CCD6624